MKSRYSRAQVARRESPRCRSHLGKIGILDARQGKHIVMTDGSRVVTIPRHNPVNAITMGNIVRDLGLINEEFRRLL